MAKAKKKETLSLEEKLELALVPIDEQPYEVPDNWCWTYLTSGFCECKDSFRKPINASGRAEREGDIPYYGATGQVGWIDDYLTDEQLVLVGEDGAPFLDTIKDKAYMIEGKAWVNNHAHILKSYYGEVGNKFILNYLNSFNYKGYVNGTTRLKLTQASMNTIPVPMPPLTEQQRIVEQIESLFAKLDDAKEKLLDTLDSFNVRKDAVLYNAFSGELSQIWRESNNVSKDTWSTVLLKDMIISGPQNGMYKEKSAYGSGTKILRIDGFYDGYIVSWDKLKRLTLTNEEFELYRLNVNDIVINRVNSMPYLGKSALVRELPEECVYESNMMRIKIDEAKVYPEYLIKYLNSMLGLQELRKNAKQAVNQASINQQDVKNVKVVLPSLEEQIEIVRLLEFLRDEEELAKEKIVAVIEQIDLMKKSILAKAFRGELGTNNPDEESAVELLKRVLK